MLFPYALIQPNPTRPFGKPKRNCKYLAPNQQLFEYRIERILGQGAFGTVYLAHDTLLDRRVAIKELTVTAQTDEVAFRRFIEVREARSSSLYRYNLSRVGEWEGG